MDQDQLVAEAYLVDLDAAYAYTAELEVAPDELPALEEFVEKWRRDAIAVASRLDAGTPVNFLRIVAVDTFAVPDTTGMTDDEALDAYYDAYDATHQVTSYRVKVVTMTTERVAEVVEKITPRIHARVRELEQARLERRETLRARRYLRRPRRRGAGRPSHRRRSRANAPPAADDGPAEPGESPSPPRAAFSRRCTACGHALVRLADGSLVCPNAQCTGGRAWC